MKRDHGITLLLLLVSIAFLLLVRSFILVSSFSFGASFLTSTKYRDNTKSSLLNVRNESWFCQKSGIYETSNLSEERILTESSCHADSSGKERPDRHYFCGKVVDNLSPWIEPRPYSRRDLVASIYTPKSELTLEEITRRDTWLAQLQYDANPLIYTVESLLDANPIMLNNRREKLNLDHDISAKLLALKDMYERFPQKPWFFFYQNNCYLNVDYALRMLSVYNGSFGKYWITAHSIPLTNLTDLNIDLNQYPNFNGRFIYSPGSTGVFLNKNSAKAVAQSVDSFLKQISAKPGNDRINADMALGILLSLLGIVPTFMDKHWADGFQNCLLDSSNQGGLLTNEYTLYARLSNREMLAAHERVMHERLDRYNPSELDRKHKEFVLEHERVVQRRNKDMNEICGTKGVIRFSHVFAAQSFRSQVEEHINFLHFSLEVFERAKKLKHGSNLSMCDSTISWPMSNTQRVDAVIALALGYSLTDYERFVGSLRWTGFKGEVILGVAEKHLIGAKTIKYLLDHNTTLKHLKLALCDDIDLNTKNVVRNKCALHYTHFKLEWSRFEMARDWLKECQACNGAVLVSDFRDLFFQEDPFKRFKGPAIELYEEDLSLINTDHWFVKGPIQRCMGEKLRPARPMLCSGTVLGDVESMEHFLNIYVAEFHRLSSIGSQCRPPKFNDQSTLNWLVYGTTKLDFARRVPFRTGIVNTIGAMGSRIRRNNTIDKIRLPISDEFGWLARRYNLTDKDGFFTNLDGSRSPVVHQYDRFGRRFSTTWLDMMRRKHWS